MQLAFSTILALLATTAVIASPLTTDRRDASLAHDDDDDDDAAAAAAKRDEAPMQGGFGEIEKLGHEVDVVFDGSLRKVPGLDCVVPDPEYDGLPGSKGNNKGKPDCASMMKPQEKQNGQ